jgi:hypothetical protein
MILDTLKTESEKNLGHLAFHTMTDCGKFYAIYGGMSRKDRISGDLYFIETNTKKIISCLYENNKDSISYLL